MASQSAATSSVTTPGGRADEEAGRSGRRPRCRSRPLPGSPRGRGTRPSGRRGRAPSPASRRRRPSGVAAAGAIALTLMPSFVPSTASVRVMPITAPFAVAYPMLPLEPEHAQTTSCSRCGRSRPRPCAATRRWMSVERAADVHGDVRADVADVDVGHRRPDDVAGVVDQRVDPAVRFDSTCRSAPARRRASTRRRRVGHAVDVVDVVDDDRAPRERPAAARSRRAPMPTAGAGDDRRPVRRKPVHAVWRQFRPKRPWSRPRRSASVPPTIALRSSSGTPTNSWSISSWLPRNVPSACG